MLETWDVVILGGGPGGSTLASCLAKRGRKALVIEREKFPRFHIGESLLPRSCEVFQKIDVASKLDARFLRKYGARFLCCETSRMSAYSFADAFECLSEFAYQVPRAEFDHLLGVQLMQIDVPCEGHTQSDARAKEQIAHLNHRTSISIDPVAESVRRMQKC